MRKVLTFVLFAALATTAAQAATPQASTTKKPASASSTTPAKPANEASHSVKGVVKSMDASSLVISRSGKSDMTFAVNADTKHEGSPAVGSQVSVRYRTEGSNNVATAVTASAAKPAKTQAKK
jgi:Domain of unknown function (DUF5666)